MGEGKGRGREANILVPTPVFDPDMEKVYIQLKSEMC